MPTGNSIPVECKYITEPLNWEDSLHERHLAPRNPCSPRRLHYDDKRLARTKRLTTIPPNEPIEVSDCVSKVTASTLRQRAVSAQRDQSDNQAAGFNSTTGRCRLPLK